jgi:hypothetical protein
VAVASATYVNGESVGVAVRIVVFNHRGRCYLHDTIQSTATWLRNRKDVAVTHEDCTSAFVMVMVALFSTVGSASIYTTSAPCSATHRFFHSFRHCENRTAP